MVGKITIPIISAIALALKQIKKIDLLEKDLLTNQIDEVI